MARRDLDAALQLLADRAQYITGASGAAIALRRSGKRDMQCRASTGSNAPELGALLSTEFGLSGESVRTRQPLRCDDAERDVRVNREVCRQLGIASVVVMPVVNDEEVLGVFELFSGEVNAFGERDLSAVQRLSEMVETAVRLAEATENLTERLRAGEISALAVAGAETEEDKILDVPILEALDGHRTVSENQAPENQILESQAAEELILEDVVPFEPKAVLDVATEEPGGQPLVVSSKVEAPEKREDAVRVPQDAKILNPPRSSAPPPHSEPGAYGVPAISDAVAEVPEPPKPPKAVLSENLVVAAQAASPPAEPVVATSADTAPSKNQLFWSAALNPAADPAKPAEADQSHVPPLLRNLRKCAACGFPVSLGRVLCVECEEKKWRGQLKAPQAGVSRQGAMPTREAIGPGAEARVFTAAPSFSAPGVPPTSTVVPTSQAERKDSKPTQQRVVPKPVGANPLGRETASGPSARPPNVSSPEFVFSSGSEPPQSWLSANKYVLAALLVVGVAVVAVFLLH